MCEKEILKLKVRISKTKPFYSSFHHCTSGMRNFFPNSIRKTKLLKNFLNGYKEARKEKKKFNQQYENRFLTMNNTKLRPALIWKLRGCWVNKVSASSVLLFSRREIPFLAIYQSASEFDEAISSSSFMMEWEKNHFFYYHFCNTCFKWLIYLRKFLSSVLGKIISN